MNAKTAKSLRRMAEAMEHTSQDKLLAKPIRTKNGDAVIAVNAQKSWRGIYRRLKHAYETDPVARETIDANIQYRAMLEREKKSGGPLFAAPPSG